jgi:Domain of unknown function (DUF4439)
MTLSADAVTAIQSAVAAELRAVFGYGMLGPRLAGPGSATLAQGGEQAHRDLAAAGSQLAPVASATATDPATPGTLTLPLVPVDDATARQLAIALESAGAAAWRYVLATLSGDPDGADNATAWTFAVGALSASAVRAVQWRRIADPATASVAFPGI